MITTIIGARHWLLGLDWRVLLWREEDNICIVFLGYKYKATTMCTVKLITTLIIVVVSHAEIQTSTFFFGKRLAPFRFPYQSVSSWRTEGLMVVVGTLI
tara:strand:- start:492 stop:788 length:297 start_codon:yes stop_codon:yes gene_type:complete